MKRTFSLVALTLFSASAVGSAQQLSAANECPHSFSELYIAVKEKLFSASNNGAASTATLYFQPSWEGTESQVTIQFPGSDTPIVTSFKLAPGQKPISSTVSSAIEEGRCDANTIARGIKITKNRVPMTDRLRAVIDRLWALDIVPRPLRSIHTDTTLYVLEVQGQEYIRVATRDYESSVAKWMDEIRVAVRDSPD
jgi:hypothetical protein